MAILENLQQLLLQLASAKTKQEREGLRAQISALKQLGTIESKELQLKQRLAAGSMTDQFNTGVGGGTSPNQRLTAMAKAIGNVRSFTEPSFERTGDAIKDDIRELYGQLNTQAAPTKKGNLPVIPKNRPELEGNIRFPFFDAQGKPGEAASGNLRDALAVEDVNNSLLGRLNNRQSLMGKLEGSLPTLGETASELKRLGGGRFLTGGGSINPFGTGFAGSGGAGGSSGGGDRVAGINPITGVAGSGARAENAGIGGKFPSFKAGQGEISAAYVNAKGGKQEDGIKFINRIAAGAGVDLGKSNIGKALNQGLPIQAAFVNERDPNSLASFVLNKGALMSGASRKKIPVGQGIYLNLFTSPENERLGFALDRLQKKLLRKGRR